MDTSTCAFLVFVLPLIASLQRVDAPVPVSFRVSGQGESIPGQPYSLTCETSPAPSSSASPRYLWVKDGGILEGHVDKVLTFGQLSETDEGYYQCMLNQAGTNAGVQLSTTFFLPVRTSCQQPSVVIKGQMVTGGDLVLSCIDLEFPTQFSAGKFVYLWFKNGLGIGTEPSRDFTLSNVTFEDDGDYTCQVQETQSGKTTPRSCKAAVFINIPPEVFIQEATGEVHKLAEGNNLSLNCLVSNQPKPSVVAGGFLWTVRHVNWTGNTSDISDREVNLTDPSQSLYPSAHRADHQLTIVAANRSHSGLYTCHASNDPEKKLTIQPATASIEVQVQCVPSTAADHSTIYVWGAVISLLIFL